MVKKFSANAGDTRHRFSPWVGKIPWNRKWQPTLVFLPGELYGQRSLADYTTVTESEPLLLILLPTFFLHPFNSFKNHILQ